MKIFYTIILSMFLMTAAFAQSINIGIKGGINLSNLRNEDQSQGDYKLGFYGGLLGHIHMSNRFALQPEVVFSRQGASYVLAGTTTKFNLDYINVPLLFQYMFDNGFRLQAGPQLGFMIRGNSKLNETNTEIKNNYKNIDGGIVLGISYVQPDTGFGVDARYNHGLANINNGTPSSYNRGFQFGLFYLFNHKD